MNRNAASARAEEPLTPLSDCEIEQLGRLLRDPSNPTAQDLLTYGGVQTGAGLIARLVIADPREREVLITAIRRAIENAVPRLTCKAHR